LQKGKGYINTDPSQNENQSPAKIQNDAPPTFNLKPVIQRDTNVRLSPLHAVPEMVCVEEAIELGIQINDIDTSLCSISNNSTRKVASVVVLFSINTQTAVNTKFQSVAVSFLSLHLPG
jgi:hypothetical protein